MHKRHEPDALVDLLHADVLAGEGIFDGTESLFKLMLAPRNPDLTSASIENDLRPIRSGACGFGQRDQTGGWPSAQLIRKMGRPAILIGTASNPKRSSQVGK
jgi:hypothetical protein